MCQKLCYMTIRREYKGGKTEDVSIKGTLCTPPPASPAQQGCPGPGVTAVPAQASVQPPAHPAGPHRLAPTASAQEWVLGGAGCAPGQRGARRVPRAPLLPTS